MRSKTLLILAVSACFCVGSVAEDATNMPVRVVITRHGRPPMEKMVVTGTNTIHRIMALFPGYEKQPQNAFASGSWAADYIVAVHLADGTKRQILVADNAWGVGNEKYTPLTTNWGSVLRQLTNTWSK